MDEKPPSLKWLVSLLLPQKLLLGMKELCCAQHREAKCQIFKVAFRKICYRLKYMAWELCLHIYAIRKLLAFLYIQPIANTGTNYLAFQNYWHTQKWWVIIYSGKVNGKKIIQQWYSFTSSQIHKQKRQFGLCVCCCCFWLFPVTVGIISAGSSGKPQDSPRRNTAGGMEGRGPCKMHPVPSLLKSR